MMYTVSVRALAEFAGRQGDLEVRFTPSTTAFEGCVGHRVVASRRGSGYLTEIPLNATIGELKVRGRADGYDPAENMLEEYKTHRGSPELLPQNRRALHWVQLKIYGALLCRRDALTHIVLRLVYFDIREQHETLLTEQLESAALAREFEAICRQFTAWAKTESVHRYRRNVWLATLTFPLVMHRPQRSLATAVYKALRCSRHLLAQSPTGSGKTLGTVFPALKAMARGNLDKLFFLVAKTSGRIAALDALGTLCSGAAPLRVLELTAKVHACVYPDNSCTPDSCPLARGFYDRLPEARRAAADVGPWTYSTLRSLGTTHTVCPYYLSQELVRWADVVVADYNYYFDGKALLHALCAEHQWRASVLVDEAHNLLPRAREMYSASLDPTAIRAVCESAPANVHRVLLALLHQWPPLQAAATQWELPEIPAALRTAIDAATTIIGDTLNEHGVALQDVIMKQFFALLSFRTLVEEAADHCVFTLAPSGELAIRNIVPARYLSPRFATSASTILFSATLSPDGYYRQLLGLDSQTDSIDIESEFRAEQLKVTAHGISTRYLNRPASVPTIAAIIERQFRAAPGNYLAFFSSFEYLHMIADGLRRHAPDIVVAEQTASMPGTERRAFLARFSVGNRAIGFAVMGGIFAEGIDLPGEQLIGAFVVTLGLPQINAVNAMMQARLQRLFGTGFEFTYLYPGLQKVVQAAGRVIRTPRDRGSLHLIDDRFTRPEVQALLPKWWQLHDA